MNKFAHNLGFMIGRGSHVAVNGVVAAAKGSGEFTTSLVDGVAEGWKAAAPVTAIEAPKTAETLREAAGLPTTHGIVLAA